MSSAGSKLERRTQSADADFDDFVREHRVSFVRYALLLSGSRAQAEDIVQDVLTRVYLRWGTVCAETGSRVAYVRRAITNEHVSWRRRWSTRHIRTGHDDVLAQATVDPWADARDDELWAQLLALPPQQRAAIVLRHYEGLSDAEIASEMQCGVSTVRSNISRGLASLRATRTGTEEERDG